jgi:NTE family protein
MPQGLWPGVAGGPQSLVLSGGASLGDFEVGVVRFLHERGYAPALIASASVGSANAVKLVEGGSIDPSGLEKIWLTNMTKNSDMYRENQDFTDFKNALSAIRPDAQNIPNDAWMTVGDVGIAGGAALLTGGAALPALAIVGLLGLSKTGIDIGKLLDALQSLERAFFKPKSISTLEPLIKLLNDPTILDQRRVINSKLKLLMATVSLETGELCYVTQRGDLLRSDAVTPYSQTQATTPKCQSLADQVHQLATAVADAGEPLANGKPNPALPGLLNQLKEAEQQLRICEAANPGATPVTGLSIVDGVIASAAIPMVFVPVQLGNESFVDGGTRSACPIRAAIQNAMTNIWAVQTSKNDVPRNLIFFLTSDVVSNFQNASWIEVAQRAGMDIMPAAIVENDIDPEGGFGAAAVTIVEPEIDIHNSMTVDPGLIRIRMMHGYM